MQPTNHTPIHHLIKKHLESTDRAGGKEAEPIPKAHESFELKEFSETEAFNNDPSETIEVQQEEPKLHPEVVQAGVEVVPSEPVTPEYMLKLPLADDKIQVGLHAPVTSSFRWLATLAMYMLKQAHISLKVVHGKLIRQAV